jgi:uncharacterized integral membrane protein (TIGR00701 family)
MDYLWLKAFHIVAAITWVGGILVSAVTIAGLFCTRAMEADQAKSALLSTVRYWDGRVTTPAMLLAWGLGLTLALKGHWFPAPWLLLKLLIVFLLSALHGVLSGCLRRLSRREERSPSAVLRYAPATTVLGMFMIVTLVVVKPF